jgi:uncharacterized damage-inducible protein DinB
VSFSGADLALLLQEANHADWESLNSALKLADGQPHPRVGWLVQHISVTKRDYWKAVSAVLNTQGPPPELNLDALSVWEVEQAAALSPEQLSAQLQPAYSDETKTVADILRLNARHTVWHAGQIAALSSGLRTV